MRRRNRKALKSSRPIEDLAEILGDVYSELKKNDGSDYKPESLGVMQASLDRLLTLIAHFRVALSLSIKARPGAQPFI